MARRGTLRSTRSSAFVLAAALAACASTQRVEAPAAESLVTNPSPPRSGGEGQGEGQATTRAAVEPITDPRAAFAEAVRLEAAGELAAAAALFERAFDADASLSHAAANAGLLRERLGDEEGARAVYAHALDVRPDCAPAARNLARLLVRRGELEPAEKDLRARLERTPEAVGLRNALADVLLAAGRLDDAEEESRRALKADERNVPAMVNLATAYHRKKRHELAKMVLENARQVDDADATVLNRLAFVELALGNRAQAFENLKAAAALRPDYPEAHANLGALLADADDFEGATTELELAVRYAPRSGAAWLNLGNAYRGTRAFEKAEAAYRKALELSPALVEAQYDLAVLYLDGEKPGLAAVDRLAQASAFFDTYEAAGGQDPSIGEHRKDLAKALEREKKRLAREERDRLRREAEARKKEDETRKDAEFAAQKAADEAAKSAAEAARAPAPAPAPTVEKVPAALETTTTTTTTTTTAPPPAGDPATRAATDAQTPSAISPPAVTRGEERGDR